MESQPEWFTHGPSSQLDTIELKGFDDLEEGVKSYSSECSGRNCSFSSYATSLVTFFIRRKMTKF